MKIILACSLGMSTSIMVKKMEAYAQAKNVDFEITAIPLSELPENLEGTDAVVLGPQVRYSLDSVEKILDGKIPYMVIDSRDYGMMKGDTVVEQVLKLLSKDD